MQMALKFSLTFIILLWYTNKNYTRRETNGEGIRGIDFKGKKQRS